MTRIRSNSIALCLVFVVNSLLLATRSFAQCGGTWTQPVPPAAPSARYAHAMAYDVSRRVTVLFGGYAPGENGETWEWDGTGWTQRSPADAPAPRGNLEMAYDSIRGVTVLFGGYTAGGINGETWEWNGVNWSRKFPALAPSARFDCAMVFDSARGVIVLFGGATAVGPVVRSAETWEWDGTNWSQRLPATSPSGRLYHAMAYDNARQVSVLFGGDTAGGVNGETWEWDGQNWVQRAPSPAPTARSLFAMAYDEARHATVLFGGYVGPMDNAETWEWDGTIWAQRLPAGAPLKRSEHAMAYDSARGASVLFGGISAGITAETWEWAGPLPAVLQQPQPLTVNRGGAAAFSVTAAGPASLTYRWYKNGEPLSDGGAIAGATSTTLTINPTVDADSGSYACAVSNPCGSTSSRTAALTVATPAGSSGCGACGVGAPLTLMFGILSFVGLRRSFGSAMRRDEAGVTVCRLALWDISFKILPDTFSVLSLALSVPVCHCARSFVRLL